MRLSTEPDRDDVRAREVLDAALDASIHVGRTPADRGFALRAGLRYCDLADGWPTPAT
jgi:hypothetical protein